MDKWDLVSQNFGVHCSYYPIFSRLSISFSQICTSCPSLKFLHYDGAFNRRGCIGRIQAITIWIYYHEEVSALYVHWRIIHIGQNLETVKRWIKNKIWFYIYVYISHVYVNVYNMCIKWNIIQPRKEGKSSICSNIDEPWCIMLNEISQMEKTNTTW